MSNQALIEDHVGEVLQRLSMLAGNRLVRVMAVTKGRSRQEALWAVAAGCQLVGENRVQEAESKWREQKPPVPLHGIGHLQTNKVKYGIQLFDAVDSLDSERLADAINQRSEQTFSVMVEVNIAGEMTKSGLTPAAVRDFVRQGYRWPHLKINGLMTVLPARRENSVEEGRIIRSYMQDMVDLWRMCREEEFPWAPLDDLSMGMSGDWEWAVEKGATVIRLGTRIFGPRLRA